MHVISHRQPFYTISQFMLLVLVPRLPARARQRHAGSQLVHVDPCIDAALNEGAHHASRRVFLLLFLLIVVLVLRCQNLRRRPSQPSAPLPKHRHTRHTAPPILNSTSIPTLPLTTAFSLSRARSIPSP